MLSRVFNMDGMLSDVQSRWAELLDDLNPLGFVSREFSMIKEFILISLTIEYFTLIIIVAVLIFGLTPSVAYLIIRIPLDWGRLWDKKKPTVEAMRLGALLANEDAV